MIYKFLEYLNGENQYLRLGITNDNEYKLIVDVQSEGFDGYGYTHFNIESLNIINNQLNNFKEKQINEIIVFDINKMSCLIIERNDLYLNIKGKIHNNHCVLNFCFNRISEQMINYTIIVNLIDELKNKKLIK